MRHQSSRFGFGANTRFSKCRFEGDLTFENCQEAGRVQLIECILSDEAEDEWARQAGRTSKRIINATTVRNALRDIFRKFIGPFGFSSIKDADKNTGPVFRNPCRELVWEELFKEKVLARHRISGVPEGGINIVDDADTKHEIRNFLDNAALGPRLQQVVNEVLRRA